MRGGASIAALPTALRSIEASGIALRFIFCDARGEVLIQRFSETRRRHPLAGEGTTLAEAIALEREALETLAAIGHHIDTSYLRANALRAFVKDFIDLDETAGLTLMFESFGFKHGLPMDADLVFDVRCLGALAEVKKMEDDIHRFISDWMPAYLRDNRTYLTVAIGCTGGQHRSVYLAEQLCARLRGTVRALVRHRALAE